MVWMECYVADLVDLDKTAGGAERRCKFSSSDVK